MNTLGPDEIMKSIRGFSVPTEDLNSVPSTHIEQLTTPCTLVTGYRYPLLTSMGTYCQNY